LILIDIRYILPAGPAINEKVFIRRTGAQCSIAQCSWLICLSFSFRQFDLHHTHVPLQNQENQVNQQFLVFEFFFIVSLFTPTQSIWNDLYLIITRLLPDLTIRVRGGAG